MGQALCGNLEKTSLQGHNRKKYDIDSLELKAGQNLFECSEPVYAIDYIHQENLIFLTIFHPVSLSIFKM